MIWLYYSYNDARANTTSTHWVSDSNVVTGWCVDHHTHRYCVTRHHVMATDASVMTTKQAGGAGVRVIVTRWSLMSPAWMCIVYMPSSQRPRSLELPTPGLTVSCQLQQSRRHKKLCWTINFDSGSKISYVNEFHVLPTALLVFKISYWASFWIRWCITAWLLMVQMSHGYLYFHVCVYLIVHCCVQWVLLLWVGYIYVMMLWNVDISLGVKSTYSNLLCVRYNSDHSRVF